MFAAFIDFSKAFDRVKPCKLGKKIRLDRDISSDIVLILMYHLRLVITVS